MFKVTITNEILGNSIQFMTLDEIRNFNTIAYQCALRALKERKHSIGMWTVELIGEFDVPKF